MRVSDIKPGDQFYFWRREHDEPTLHTAVSVSPKMILTDYGLGKVYKDRGHFFPVTPETTALVQDLNSALLKSRAISNNLRTLKTEE